MTNKEKLTAIKDNLAAGLPALLVAPLEDFEEYFIGVAVDGEKRQILTYMNMYSPDDGSGNAMTKIIIRACIPRPTDLILDFELDYEAVITPYIDENITAGLIGETERISIMVDPWPANERGGIAYIDYDLTFITYLDKCG